MQSKYVVNDVECQTVFDKEDELIQFQEVSHILVTSNKPVNHEIEEKDIPFVEIPDLYPVKHTVTLPPQHFYSEASKYRKYWKSYLPETSIFLLCYIKVVGNLIHRQASLINISCSIKSRGHRIYVSINK